MIFPCIRFLAALFSLLTLFSVAAAALPVVEPGNLLALSIPGNSKSAPKVYFGQFRTAVVGNRSQWRALIAISLDALPGTYIATWWDTQDTVQALEFRVSEQSTDSSQLTIASTGDDFKRKQQRQNNKEQRTLARVFRHWQKGEFPGNHLQAVFKTGAGVKTSKTGVRPIGVQYRPSRESRLTTPASGKVVWLKKVAGQGLVLIVEHSQGLYSMFNQIKNPLVKLNQEVKPGDTLAKIEMKEAGTVSMLTWSLVLNGTIISPDVFLEPPD